MPDDIAAQLRRELAAASAGLSHRDAAEQMRIVTDSFLVRHPGHASRLEDILRVTEESLTAGPAPAEGDLEMTVAVARNQEASQPLDEDDPRQLGRYRILRRLGRGGMGIVLLAEDEDMHRRVAVKILPPALASSPDALERFQREAAAAAELNHPAIVPIYDVGTDQGYCYYAMRYVQGERFRDYARRVLRPAITPDADQEAKTGSFLRQAIGLIRTTARIRAHVTISARGIAGILRVAEQVARGLAHAHTHGVIHRDIKPANIMVDSQGSAQLFDFGLAKSTANATMTKTGLLVGTVAYMAPEQISEELGKVDGRTDIYGLGVTLFECLAGCRPFHGATSEALMFQALHKQPPSPLVFVPELSRDIETIILKCLEKKPERRYQTANELAEDIARVRAHRRIEAQPVGMIGKLVRWSEHHRKLAATALIAVLLLTAVPVLSWQRDLAEARKRRTEFQAADKESREAMNSYRSLIADLGVIEAEVRDRRNSTPEYLPAETAQKERLLELESERHRLDAVLKERALRARFAHVRAREILGVPDPAAEKRFAGFLYEQFLRAEQRGDTRAAEALRVELANTAYAARLDGSGRLTLTTRPAGCRYEIRRWQDDAGILTLSKSVIRAGETPILDLELPVGSYNVVLSCDGYLSVTYPVLIERGEHWGHESWHDGLFSKENWTVSLPERSAYDSADWVVVPAGPFRSLENRDEDPRGATHVWRWVPSFVMQRHEMTGRAYAQYLDSPAVADKRRTKAPFRFIPHSASGTADQIYVEVFEDGTTPPMIREEMLDAPVGGLSQRNARQYAAWLGKERKATVLLPSAVEWEKAARGVDGRLYPWGNRFHPRYVRLYGMDGGVLRAPTSSTVNSQDQSPYGIHNLSGGLREWCRDGHDLRDGLINPFLVGGSAAYGQISGRSYMAVPRTFMAFDNTMFNSGFRVIVTGQEERR